MIAVAAVDRLHAGWLERNLGFYAATGAVYCVELAFATTAACLLLAVFAADNAASGIVLETFFRVKLLFLHSEDELTTAVLANKGLVLH